MEKQKTKDDNIGKILEYWYTLDFLGQDKFPKMVEPDEMGNFPVPEEVDGESEKKTCKRCLRFDNTGIIQRVKEDAERCGMKGWGKVTVYLGRIRRETCIKKIISRLNLADDRPEESFDHIAFAAFQVDEDGNFVEESFSLSPVLWAVRQLEKSGEKFSRQITSGGFFNDSYNYELVLLKDRKSDEKYRVKPEDIDRLYDAIWKELVEDVYVGKDKIKNERLYAFQYQMFKGKDNEKSGENKNKSEDDIPFRLGWAHFSNDLNMLIDEHTHGELNETMQDYILALHEKRSGIKKRKRIDLVHSSSPEEYRLWLSDILRMKNAPLGKWPSKYMPALMQQIAVNLLVSNELRQKFGENGKVFSVNGPPGTGKTTMLKEIVANNVVERAALLAEYEKPDDAFIEKDFEKGPYSRYVKKWHKLENDKIKDYSILVASSNNAAVENISKELPLEGGILDALKAGSNASETERKQLDEVRKLFDASEPEEGETSITTGNAQKDCKDIYFTEYAGKLLENENKAWGLIAAALGNRDNKSKFFASVLGSVARGCYTAEMLKNSRQRYAEAREKFREQYDKVKGMRETLDQLGQLIEERIVKQQKLECIIAKNSQFIKEKEGMLKGQKEYLSELKGLKQEWEEMNKELLKKWKEAGEHWSKTGWFSRLFKREEYEANKNAAKSCEEEAKKLENVISEKKAVIREYINRPSVILDSDDPVEMDTKLRKRINESEEKISEIGKRIQALNARIEKAEEALNAVEKGYAEIISNFKNETEGKGIILDEDYIEKILSKDEVESTRAQAGNPWATQQYNREREKLFYRAMKLNKEFVLSSKACRDNFRSLGHYWGYLPKDDEDQKFMESSECIMALLDTLFLLVPVISSTFASVGSFFKDARVSGAIGLLIVDEAGQASPHMAAGALYRARKAIIVGDPRQIEPVVTDELKFLKQAFKEEIYSPYKQKNVSVQNCADFMNPFGTYMENESDHPDWVGCPLLVHRRCISPMYEISNQLSYGGMMKQQTAAPNTEIEEKFILDRSQWINIAGREKGNKNHFVEEQGDKVCEMLEIAFKQNQSPDVFVISPFRSVKSGMEKHIKNYVKDHPKSKLKALKNNSQWIKTHVGTIHTFQGREANEVIFLLGCDDSENASSAIRWVNDNIVNVAVTRAKYRLYVIGDECAWSSSRCVRLVYDTIKSTES